MAGLFVCGKLPQLYPDAPAKSRVEDHGVRLMASVGL
jgi:hypothetical protein